MVPQALTESSLDGYATPFNNQQHVNFLAGVPNDAHVFELYFDNDHNVWHYNDLTQLAGAPPALYPTGIDGYVTSFNNQQHVNFLAGVGNDVHVFELYYDNVWHHNDLTQLAGAPPVVNRLISTPHGYVTSFNNQQHVNFIGNDFHVHELYYDGAWRHNDLSQITGAPPAGEIVNQEEASWVSVLDGYETSFNQQQHVNFVGTDFHVHELYYDGAWHHNDLTQITNAPLAAPFALDGYETAFNNQQHVNFLGTNGHVYELYYDNAWHLNDLTQLTGAPTAVNPSAIVGYVTSFNSQQHVNFIGFVGSELHIFELYYDNAWHHNDLTQLAGAPLVNGNANKFGLDGYVTAFNQQLHVNFIGNDLHIHELYYDGAWRHNDLSAIAK